MNPLAVARAVRDAVLEVSGVAAISPGLGTEVATYGVEERVEGVAVRQAADAVAVEVHVVAAYHEGMSLPALADQIRHAARQAIEQFSGPSSGAGRGSAPAALGVSVGRIDAVIDDLQVEGV